LIYDEEIASAFSFDIDTLDSDKDFWIYTICLYFEQAYQAFLKESQSHTQISTPKLTTSAPAVVTPPPNVSTHIGIGISPVPSETNSTSTQFTESSATNSDINIFDYSIGCSTSLVSPSIGTYPADFFRHSENLRRSEQQPHGVRAPSGEPDYFLARVSG
jgi:hypothetical protein